MNKVLNKNSEYTKELKEFLKDQDISKKELSEMLNMTEKSLQGGLIPSRVQPLWVRSFVIGKRLTEQKIKKTLNIL